MKNNYFQSLEQLSYDDSRPLNEVIEKLTFNDQGLVPVTTQDARSKSVLMTAWMNQAALEQTLTSGRMTYWSRSRKSFWIKGETSGHTQELINMSFDCDGDGDAILCEVNQKGAACHTGRPNCFYLNVEREQRKVTLLF